MTTAANGATTISASSTHNKATRSVNWLAMGLVPVAALWLTQHPAALPTTPQLSVAAHEETVDAPDFRSVDGQERKDKFLDFMRPIAAEVVGAAERDRAALRAIIARTTNGAVTSRNDRDTVARLARDYRVDVDGASVDSVLHELTSRVDAIPTSLLLAQAAKESGWGTSRFAVEANSYFGERCYEPGCGLAPAALKNPAFNVERFSSATESARSYLLNINSHPRYEEFRQLRRQLRERGEPLDSIALAATLDGYSERRQAYVNEIASLIVSNGLSTTQ